MKKKLIKWIEQKNPGAQNIRKIISRLIILMGRNIELD